MSEEKIDKWADYVLEREGRLQPLMDAYCDRVKNNRASVKDLALAIKTHIKKKDPVPPLSWLDSTIFNAINPYDIIDELLRKNPESWAAYNYPANLHLKLNMNYNPPKDRAKIQEIKDYNKEHGRFNPQTKCINCFSPVHIYYRNSKKIPERTDKNVCQCSGGKRIREAWDIERSNYRKDLKEKAVYKKRQAEKSKRHKKRR